MHKIFHSSDKYLLIIKTYIQSVTAKIKNYVSKDWIVKTIVGYAINIF